MSVPKAFWLGAAFGGTIGTVQLSGGHALDGRTLLENTSFELNTMISEADIAFLRGMLAHNSHLDPEETHQTLRTCAKKNAIDGRRSLTAASKVIVQQSVIELQALMAAEADAAGSS